jgi:hypothetical protein
MIKIIVGAAARLDTGSACSVVHPWQAIDSNNPAATDLFIGD